MRVVEEVWSPEERCYVRELEMRDASDVVAMVMRESSEFPALVSLPRGRPRVQVGDWFTRRHGEGVGKILADPPFA
jgi:hypothetical protein